jgi:SAM-dependent methyltransferase
MDIAPTAITNLSRRHPEATFLLADVSEQPPPGRFDLVNAFDVLYHITDDERWANAVRNLAAAVEPGGLLLISDTFSDTPGLAEHNRMRPLRRYEELLAPADLRVVALRPTHVLLNRELGAFRALNRLPGLLLAADRALLSLGFGREPHTNKLLVARREG